MSAISCLLMAIVLFGSSKVYPRSIEGLKHWGWGALGFGVANLLFSLRGLAPDWLSIIVANMIGVSSFIVWWRGMRLLRGLALSS
ncbi:MAG: GGDEF domain-containing protein, partial [Burkholderiales bacterium]|nr:GGDEF domain-containing protein [Burkholderiales bacterium]